MSINNIDMFVNGNCSTIDSLSLHMIRVKQDQFLSDGTINLQQVFEHCVLDSISNHIHKEFFESILMNKQCPVSYFVAQSFSAAGKVGQMETNSIPKLSKEESLFHLMLSKLCTSLTHPQRNLMLALMRYMI